MPENKSFYITTTLPYVNAKPHVGHALEFVRADIVARYKALMGFNVFLNTGTDEHGAKIHKKALEEGVSAQEYVDRFAKNFEDLTNFLGMAKDVPGITFNFIRTTSPTHITAAQEFWKVCDKNGYIYKKDYRIKYCVGCELEKTESELIDGKCPLHPNLEIELIEEENYFFKASTFTEELKKHFASHPDFVVPESRHNEMVAFLRRGIEDFSISRLKEKMPWGIAVPGDDTHVMYVWFDALVNYISAIGWPTDMAIFEKWWPVTQCCGKDNTRQQSVMWQSMLLAAGLPLSKQIIVNGFVTGEGGVKMSKSLGNVIDPVEIINEYGTDAFRYFVARELHPFEDSPFTVDKFVEAYNANLVNGLGNLVSRIMKMATSYGVELSSADKETLYYSPAENQKHQMFDRFNLLEEMNDIWLTIANLDKTIQTEEPFKKIKTDPEGAKKDVYTLLLRLLGIALRLEPFMPRASRAIRDLVKENKTPEAPLFPRKS